MHALGLQIVTLTIASKRGWRDGSAVATYAASYMGEIFCRRRARPRLGHAFGFIVSIVFALLLLSAVNTAIVDLIMIIPHGAGS